MSLDQEKINGMSNRMSRRITLDITNESAYHSEARPSNWRKGMLMKWFDVDKQGLAKLVERRGLAWVVFEVVQNAWDENATRVDVTLTPIDGKPYAFLRVEDDSPEGFRDLSHSFTLFAESYKKEHEGKRGRFNLGEKLVLAMAEDATIASTTGIVSFSAEGRTVNSRIRRAKGTVFEATIRMTRSQYSEVAAEVVRLISPIPTTFNGVLLAKRVPCAKGSNRLLTEISDENGVMHRAYRVAEVEVLETDDRPGWLFEMGIPVCETGDTHDYNVLQRVPLGMERDGVPESFLRDVRTIAIKALTDNNLVTAEVASSPWVGDALEDERVDAAAVTRVIEQRYGDKRVIFDPSDTEANRRAVAEGYSVIHGGAFSKAQWNNIKTAGAAKPAGAVTPTPKPFNADGTPLSVLPCEQWTEEHVRFADFARWVASVTIPGSIIVAYSVDDGWNADWHGAFSSKRILYVSLDFLQQAMSYQEEMLDFLIHEFGHVEDHDHLDAAYHVWLTRIGARLALALVKEPNKLTKLYATKAARI